MIFVSLIHIFTLFIKVAKTTYRGHDLRELYRTLTNRCVHSTTNGLPFTSTVFCSSSRGFRDRYRKSLEQKNKTICIDTTRVSENMFGFVVIGWTEPLISHSLSAFLLCCTTHSSSCFCVCSTYQLGLKSEVKSISYRNMYIYTHTHTPSPWPDRTFFFTRIFAQGNIWLKIIH